MTVEQLMNELEAMLAEYDGKVLDNTQAWAKRQIAALREFKQTEEYQKLHAIAGGKTWYGVFSQGETRTKQFVFKNCEATVKARNAKIASKLTKAGVLEIKHADVTRRSDGFNGLYTVSTDNGNRLVKIETILAGGHNIQCLHHRVLVTVK